MQSRHIRVSILVPVFLGIITTIALGVYAVLNIQTVSNAIENQLIDKNKALTKKSAERLVLPLGDSSSDTINYILDEFILEDGILYTAARDSTSNVIADARVGGTLPPGQLLKELSQQAISRQEILVEQVQNILYVIVPITADTTSLGTLEIAYDLDVTQGTIQRATISSLIYGITIVIAVGLISYLFTRYATGQLQKVVKAAEEIRMGNLDTEVPIIRLTEVAIVGETLNNTRLELKKLYADLDNQLENYEKRNRYLQATATIARDTTALTDLQELLGNVINLIEKRFDFNQQGIFLLDESKDWAVLRAVSGEGSQRLIDRNIRFKVGHEGIIGHVTATGNLHVSQNVAEDEYFTSDITTKETRSEAVFPLKSHEVIFGALDIQSNKINAFTDDEIGILHTLADQIAIAIMNTRLFQQAKEDSDLIQKSYTEYGRETLGGIKKGGRPTIGYYSDAGGTKPLSKIPETIELDDLTELELPLVAHGGEIVGKIIARKPIAEGDWDHDEISVMEALVSQLGIALESAQLFQDVQQRATREQLISDITAKVRKTLNVETVLETAASELGKTLGLAALDIHLGNPPKSNSSNNASI